MPEPRENIKSPWHERISSSLLIGFFFFLLVSIILLSLVPPVSRDALIHHLAIPKLYLQHGGLYEIPFLKFSYYPMNLDLLYMIPLYFGNDIVPKFIHFSFALLTAWLLFSYLKSRCGRVYGLLGAVFFLSIPIIVKLSITVYVDLGLLFFTTASILLIFRWAEAGFRTRELIFSGILCGLALGTKYNGLITFFLLTLFSVFIQSRHGKKDRISSLRALTSGMVFCLIALTVFSPWLIRNFLWTSNPIFPLFNAWFNPDAVIAGKNIDPFSVRRILYDEAWWETMLLPLRIFFQGQDNNPQYFDGRLNPFLLIFPFFAFIRPERDAFSVRFEKQTLLAFSVLFFFFAFFKTGLRIRYIAPIIPFLVILSAWGVRNMVQSARNIGNVAVRQAGLGVVITLIVFCFWLNIAYVMKQFNVVRPLDYLSGELSRDEYIYRFRPEHHAMQYINSNLAEDARVLFLYIGKRGYYCDRAYLPGIEVLKSIIEKSGSSLFILNELRELGVTHILIRHDLFSEWIENNMDPEKRYMFGQFFKRSLQRIYSKAGYGLYSL